MHAIHDHAEPGLLRLERGRNWAGLAAIERPHGIEQMRKAAEARRHCFFCLRIGGHRVAKRNAHTFSRERSDKFQWAPVQAPA